MPDGAQAKSATTTSPFGPHVRIAEPRDRDALRALLVEAWRDNGVFALSMDRVEEHIDKCVDHKGGIALVIDGTDGLAASMGLFLGQPWYTEEWSLSDHWNFVRPAYRHTGAAVELIEASKVAADRLKVVLSVAVTSLKRTSAKVRLYQRYYTMIGAIYAHGVEYADGPLSQRLADGTAEDEGPESVESPDAEAVSDVVEAPVIEESPGSMEENPDGL